MFFFPKFRFHFHFFCGAAAVPCCAFSPVHTAVTRNKKISTLRTLGMYVRTACERIARVAKRMCLPTFSPEAWRRDSWHIKSPVCNYNHKKTIFNHGPLSVSHNLMCFSFLSERSGLRRPPAERSALYFIYTVDETIPGGLVG